MTRCLATSFGLLAMVLWVLPVTGCVPASPDNGDGQGGTTASSGVSGQYTPGQELELTDGVVTITVDADAADEAFTLTLREADDDDITVAPPEGVELAGAVFGPEGQTFSPPAEVTLQLSTQTVATRLPVLAFDEDAGRWVGTGANAIVAANGVDVTFLVSHFSIYGVPDALPISSGGDPIGSFVVISNNGSFSSDEISSDTASLLYSEFGDTFSVSMTSQDLGTGGIETASLGLNAQSVSGVGNFVVGVLAGGRSIFNGGDFNEPVYGVMIMSVSGSTVTVSVFAATSERAIFGTLTGQSL